jgi:hypothetical protein
MNDNGLGDKLREAATNVALDLGGWKKRARTKARG